MKKKKIHKLSMFDNEAIILIGIVCYEHDYKVSWAINNKLNIKLTKSTEITNNYSKNGVELTRIFSSFFYVNQEIEQQFVLLSNKSENNFLIPKLKNVDYIFQISGGEVTDQYMFEIIRKLKEIDIVLMAFSIDKNLHKKINNYFHL